MIFYLPAVNVSLAQAVSHTVWRVAHPSPPGLSQYAFGWGTHKDGEAFGCHMIIPADLVISIHPDADEHAFDAILGQFVIQGLISQDDVDRVVNTIDSRRNRKVPVLSFFPPYWIDLMKTKEDLEEQGYFEDA